MRYDRMGCVSPGVLTPALDRLAAEGVRFSRAYSSTPTCTPARAAILTGLKPWHHGMLGFGNVAPTYEFEMPSALAAIGYSTTVIGKDHFGWNASATPTMDFEDHGSGVKHGYERLSIYDGADEPVRRGPDDYDQFFERERPTRLPAAPAFPLQDDNSWTGRAYPYPEEYHPTAWVGRQAVAYITQQVNSSDPRPWMLKVSFHRPHSPYDPPARLLRSSPESHLPPIVTSLDGWDTAFGQSAHGCGNISHIQAMSAPHGTIRSSSSPGVDAWCGDMPTAERTTAREAYYANIRFVDEWVDKIVDTLESTEQLDRTLIVWTADHGDGQADHFHWRKGFPYEFSSHIPFLLRWPASASLGIAVSRGVVIDELVELRDLFPTLLDAAGALDTMTVGRQLDGVSLLHLLRKPSEHSVRWRTILDLEHDVCYNGTVKWNALVTRNDPEAGSGVMKYIWHASPGVVLPYEQLFNLTADPHERTDLARTVSEAKLGQWRQRLARQWQEEGRGPRWFDATTMRPLPRNVSQLYSPHFPTEDNGLARPD